MEWEWMEPSGAGQALDASFVAWVTGLFDFFLDGAVVLAGLLTFVAIVATWKITRVRRRFWCHLVRRDVEVEFEMRGLLRRLVTVTRCPAFEDDAAISCARRCLDVSFRRQWDPPLPVNAHRDI